ncbi:MAG: hypothetical protein GY859_00245, partial [Desulfobacterales bacterium]|nr:hypothetical protein [Desulfobacterales bacterium]
DVDGGSLDGFRITGGTGSGDEYRVQGGGVHVYGGSPTISGNTIENNDTRHPEISNVGGGVSSEDSDVRILDNVIRNNHADRGAGIAVNGGSAVIRDNTVQGNIAVSDHGGGLYIGAPDVEISHNMVLDNEVGRELGYGWGGGAIVLGGETSAALSYNTYSGNYAPTAGGGVFVDDGADATLEHELIYDNESVERGAGVYVDGAWDEIGSTAAITNCTIVNNTCTDCMGGCGLFVEYFSNTIIKDSILWGHGGDDIFADETSTAAVTYTISEQSIAGAGNLNSDPLFVDAENNDYHLQSQTGRWSPAAGDWVADSNHSPGIDSGDPESFYVNEPDPNGGRVNMGVHGNSDQAGKGLSGATQPRLDIKANGLDGPVTVQSGDPAAIALSLDPGGRSGQVADWWIIETAPGSTINHFDVGALSFISGVATTHQGPLVAFSNLPLPAPAGMTPGTHTFFFIVDMNMNNVLDVDQAFYDLVSVIVSE